MTDLKFSKKIEEKKIAHVKREKFNLKGFIKGSFVPEFKNSVKAPSEVEGTSWNYLLVFFFFGVLFFFVVAELSSLQIVHGEEMYDKSVNNQVRIRSIPAYRGVVFDKDGVKVAENVASMNVFLAVEHYLDSEGYIDTELLQKTADTLGGILGDHWKSSSDDGLIQYTSISEKVYKVHEDSPYFTEILIASDINDDMAIKIKANTDSLPGVYIDNGNKRFYPYSEIVSNVLGYTGDVTAQDLETLDYVDSTDVLGRTGIEKYYDQKLIGVDGKIAWEVDAVGRTIEKDGYVLEEAISGQNLYLTIDIDTQKKMYEVLQKGVKDYKAAGAAGVIENVQTGELLSLVSYPGYDNNLFIGGISQGDYNSLLNDKYNPLLNRAIAAQVPAGSTFKTMVATGALDSGAITRTTQYVSRTGYTFTSGAPFQEYRNHAYGVVNVIDALSVSSNIFFCEVIRHWNMNALVPYLEKFGIGQTTGIDIPGEAAGRLPSPANKIALSATSPWLDAVWYPEGDSCNSVIGQGIGLVTPVQMANWIAAIANNGTLKSPHLANYFTNEKGEKEYLSFTDKYTSIASSEALSIVREGMWSAVNGPRRTIGTLSNLGVSVAAKTGTAEFGALNKKGEYEHTHAWVTGFFPYENPKYSFSIFLEDGGESLNAVKIMKEMIVWMVKEGLVN